MDKKDDVEKKSLLSTTISIVDTSGDATNKTSSPNCADNDAKKVASVTEADKAKTKKLEKSVTKVLNTQFYFREFLRIWNLKEVFENFETKILLTEKNTNNSRR